MIPISFSLLNKVIQISLLDCFTGWLPFLKKIFFFCIWFGILACRRILKRSYFCLSFHPFSRLGGYFHLISWAVCLSIQSCLTLCDPMDYSPPGSSVHGIFQARVLEWGAIAFSKRGLKYLYILLIFAKLNNNIYKSFKSFSPARND